MYKSDLKQGKHVVELENGRKAIFLSDGFVGDNGEGVASIHSYFDDLQHKFLEGYSVVAIYELNLFSVSHNLKSIVRESNQIWRRESSEYDKLMKQIDKLKAQAEKLKPL